MSTPEGAVLNSWKEIANYLDRGVRTVQRWESQLALPVHRFRPAKRTPVFAFPSELMTWLETIALNDRTRTQQFAGDSETAERLRAGRHQRAGRRPA